MTAGAPRIVDLSAYSLSEFDGWCLELVNDLLHKYPDGEILYLEFVSGPWKYHAALVLDGIVHDAWNPTVRLPPADYVRTVFGDGATWEINPGSDEWE